MIIFLLYVLLAVVILAAIHYALQYAGVPQPARLLIVLALAVIVAIWLVQGGASWRAWP